ncbi:MAG TPA: type IV pilus modification protein PilV [Steroidobacteraceae bacterium]|jgi:type IV pilus assembly protein PilV|nr:type IV pilus modification protein PilV [Steroidobacteraceae bacterium]
MTNHTHQLRRGASRTSGFTLIEVLVSIVILSIGLLGIAKLMLFSSRSNDSAYLRSQATALAYEILDNMRANRQEAINKTYDTLAATPATAPAKLCTGATQCATNELALYDVYQWKLRLTTASNAGGTFVGALPSGAGSVTTPALGTTPTTVVITVSWDDTVAQSTYGAAGNIQTITLETLL